jgi:hypothetical protein
MSGPRGLLEELDTCGARRLAERIAVLAQSGAAHLSRRRLDLDISDRRQRALDRCDGRRLRVNGPIA